MRRPRAFATVLAVLGIMVIGRWAGADEAAKSSFTFKLPYSVQDRFLAPWTRPARPSGQQAFTDASARKIAHDAVVLVGGVADKGMGGDGTGFVISRRHRLVATNAHVADIFRMAGKLQVMANGQPTVYEVDRIWYHPGVIRFVNNQLTVSATDPSLGDIFADCPDVAVLQLAGDTELPAEMPLANWDEIKDLFAQDVAMLGFPGYDTDWLRKGGRFPEATYHEGVISRQTDMNGDDDAPVSQMQHLAHTAGSFPGFSGSPLLLPNGHVIGLNNAGGAVSEEGTSAVLSYGIRVDCLWELLAYHGLDSKVTIPVDVASLNLDRFKQTSESLITLNKARDLVAQATIAFGERKYQESMNLAQQASGVLRTYASAYQAEANVWEYFTIASNLSLEEKIKNWTEAARCRHNAVILKPSDNSAAIDWYRAQQSLIIWLRAQQSPKISKDLIAAEANLNQAIANELTVRGLTEPQVSELLWMQSRAEQDTNKALELINNAITAFPYRGEYFDQRSALYGKTGNQDQAAQDAKAAQDWYASFYKIQECQGSTLKGLNDPSALKQGISQLTELCKATNWTWYESIWNLGLAYTQADDEANAVQTLAKAVAAAPNTLKWQVQRDLNLTRYRAVKGVVTKDESNK